jgi:hypothetical protein
LDVDVYRAGRNEAALYHYLVKIRRFLFSCQSGKAKAGRGSGCLLSSGWVDKVHTGTTDVNKDLAIKLHLLNWTSQNLNKHYSLIREY